MVNVTFLFSAFVFLVYKKIFLLNEETLILLCFVVFVFLTTNYLKKMIYESLIDQSIKIKNNFKNSIKQLFLLFSTFSRLKINLNQLKQKFVVLNNYYNKLTLLLVLTLPNFNKGKIVLIYQKRLEYLKKVEWQTSKFIALIIIKKLNQIIKLKQFYSNNIKNNNFLCFNAITLREYIHLVNTKK